jgi:hypothetical protein
MAKKKQKLVLNYKKNTSVDMQEVRDIINSTEEVYLLQQAKYDDGSESISIQVHFTPKQK